MANNENSESGQNKLVGRTLMFTPEGNEQILKMMAELGVSNFKDLANYSLSLMQWAISSKKAGAKICKINAATDTVQEFIFEPLEKLRISNSNDGVSSGSEDIEWPNPDE